MADKTNNIPIYLYKESVADLLKAVDISERKYCNALITSITNPIFRREFHKEPLKQNHSRFTRSGLLLGPSKLQTRVVAKLSDSIDCDSADENVRRNSELTIKQEIAFAQHVASHGSILIKVRGTNTFNLACTIVSQFTGISNYP